MERGTTDMGSALAPVVERALRDERVRTARGFDRFRFIGVTAFLLLAAVVEGVFRLPDWRVHWPTFLAYWAAAGVVWLAGDRFDPERRFGGFTIPLVDMPVVAFLQWDALAVASPGLIYGSTCGLLMLLIIA